MIKYVGSRGYITALDSTDSEDWQRPGIKTIIKNATPKHGKGAIVLMHDSGGDRSQTVAALDTFLPQLQGKGYTFVNLTEALNAPSAHTPVTGMDLWKGKAFVFAVQVSEHTTDILVGGLAVIGVLVFARFGLMLILSFLHARKVRARGFRWGPEVIEPVSVIVPAYNERECIANTVRSLMASRRAIALLARPAAWSCAAV